MKTALLLCCVRLIAVSSHLPSLIILTRPQKLYDLYPSAAGAFLDAETAGGMQGMLEMLLLCPGRLVREAMRGFYLHLLGILAEGEGDRYA